MKSWEDGRQERRHNTWVAIVLRATLSPCSDFEPKARSVHAVKALARAALAAIALPRGSGEGIPTAPCAIVAFPAGGTLDVLAPAQKLSNW
jgi:hypothetical protein